MDWNLKREHAVQHAVAAGFGAADATALADACRPALRLVPGSGSDAPVGVSKIGGRPDLPPDVAWPIGKFGPMTFCAQVQLSDTTALAGVEGWVSGDALLYFFVDVEPDSAEASGGRVLTAPRERAVEREAPDNLPATYLFNDEAPIALVPVLTPPMSFDQGPDLEHDFDADSWKAWEGFYESLGCGQPIITAGQHQLLGNPWQVGSLDPVWMGGVRLATEDEDPDDADNPFRLLAQFTNDIAANVEIADGGAIYFVGRHSDFARWAFDDVVVFMESH